VKRTYQFLDRKCAQLSILAPIRFIGLVLPYVIIDIITPLTLSSEKMFESCIRDIFFCRHIQKLPYANVSLMSVRPRGKSRLSLVGLS
jgi:hypothetical protein